MAAETTLREITKETVRLVTALDVGPDQDGLVAPNSVSIAEAHFEPKASFWAIYFGEEPAGFAMVWRDPDERVSTSGGSWSTRASKERASAGARSSCCLTKPAPTASTR